MEPIEERMKRAHEAGIRLAITEVEVAESLLGAVDGMSDPKEKAKSLREIGMTVDLAARLVSTMPVEDARGDAIWKRIQDLRARLDQFAAMIPASATRRPRTRGVGHTL